MYMCRCLAKLWALRLRRAGDSPPQAATLSALTRPPLTPPADGAACPKAAALVGEEAAGGSKAEPLFYVDEAKKSEYLASPWLR